MPENHLKEQSSSTHNPVNHMSQQFGRIVYFYTFGTDLVQIIERCYSLINYFYKILYKATVLNECLLELQ